MKNNWIIRENGVFFRYIETTICFHGNENLSSLSRTRFVLINVGQQSECFQKLPVVPETLSIGAAIYQIQPISRFPAKSFERTNGQRKLVGRKRCGLRTKGRTICNYVSFHSICASKLNSEYRHIISPLSLLVLLHRISLTLFRLMLFVLVLIVFVTKYSRVGNRYSQSSIFLPAALYTCTKPLNSCDTIPVKYQEISVKRRAFIKNPIRAFI